MIPNAMLFGYVFAQCVGAVWVAVLVAAPEAALQAQ